MDSIKYPRVVIEYCAACKWHNRAVWYLQEILQTFGSPEKHFIPEVALQPVYDSPGIFQITLCKSQDGEPQIIYKRRLKKAKESQSASYYYDGFPDSKLLKSLLRNILFPTENLGHIDRFSKAECEDCKLEE